MRNFSEIFKHSERNLFEYKTQAWWRLKLQNVILGNDKGPFLIWEKEKETTMPIINTKQIFIIRCNSCTIFSGKSQGIKYF